MAENEIENISGLKDLPLLDKLHLRKNKLIEFSPDTLPDLPSVTYINLRENEISETRTLGSLVKFRKLKYLNILGTPLSEEHGENTKREVLIVLAKPTIINKDLVTQEDRDEAQAEKEERQRLEEEARLEAERAAAEAAAEAAAQEDEEQDEA